MVKEIQTVYQDGKRTRLPHVVYLPPEYEADSEQRWPLLIFLHGAGERGDDLQGMYLHGPFREIREGREFPCVIVAPQVPENSCWEAFQETLETMLDEWIDTYHIDTSRVYLTGLSMGGYGTWSWSALYPHRFAAVAPLCGSGDPYRVGRLRSVPVWAFHGDCDDIVPFAGTANMVEQLQKCGGNVRFTVCEGVGHDCWTETYHGTELYEWLLSHRK